MNWLNIIVLAVFVLCIMNGIRRGFIRTIAAMFSILCEHGAGLFPEPLCGGFCGREDTDL